MYFRAGSPFLLLIETPPTHKRSLHHIGDGTGLGLGLGLGVAVGVGVGVLVFVVVMVVLAVVVVEVEAGVMDGVVVGALVNPHL